MKRIISLTLVVLLIAALFVGCGKSDSNPVGSYTFKSINGKSLKDYFASYEEEAAAAGMDLNALLALLGIDLDHPEQFMTLELKEDGTGKLTSKMMGEEDGVDATWKLDGDKLTLTVDGEAQECTFKNGEITLTIEEDGETNTVILSK